MAISKLQIIIEAVDNASATLSGVGKSLEATSKDFTKFGVGITAVGIGLTGLLVKSGMTAARVEVLGTVLKSIGRVSGISSDVLDKQEETIKGLGITTKSARELLIKFMQSQLDVADAAKIARVAQDLAVISGQNSSEAAGTLTNAIVSQNTVLLKQFGIVQNLNTIYSDQAERLGISVDELTDVEKKQAFLNVILEEGLKVAGTYEAAMGDVGKQMSSLARLTEEAEVAFGEAFLPVIEKVVEGLTGMLKAYLELSPESQKMITNITMIGAAMGLIIGPILLLIGYLPALGKGFLILKGPVGWTILAIIELITIISLLYFNWDNLPKFFKETWEGIKIIFQESINFIGDKIQDLIGWFETLPGKIWEAIKSVPAKLEEAFYMPVKFKIPDFNMPSLPSWLQFQEGGIVPGARGQAVPIIAHGGEMITPSGKGSGIGTINIYIQGGNYLDRDAGEKFAEEIGKILRRDLRF